MACLLLGWLVPRVACRAREQANRVKCASNLRQIGQGIQMYANENKGNFPRTVYDDVGGTPTEYTAPDASNPFEPGGPGPNDVTAALFLLLRTQDLTSEIFICPTSQGERLTFDGKDVSKVSNFPSGLHLTYSYTNPYPTPEAVKQGFKLNYELTSDFAIAADINPGPPGVVNVKPTSTRREMSTANSGNHNGDGQNVLYADGHVEFQNTPFCGMMRDAAKPTRYRDNVYTFGAGFGATTAGVGVKGPPADALDSVLLPVSTFGPGTGGPGGRGIPDGRPMTWLLALAAAGVMVAVILLITFLARSTNPPAAPRVE
jgi:prepilin-type processing-associated H-X9-DG protein